MTEQVSLLTVEEAARRRVAEPGLTVAEAEALAADLMGRLDRPEGPRGRRCRCLPGPLVLEEARCVKCGKGAPLT